MGKNLKKSLIKAQGCIFLVLLMIYVSPVLADLGTFKQGDCVSIKAIINSTFVNISTISYPNSTLAASNLAMTKIGYTFNYSFCSTQKVGDYRYDYFDVGGNVYKDSFTITPNGQNTPSGGIVVLFSIIFIMLAGLSCYLVAYTLGHFASMDFDVVDLSIDFGLFFVIMVSFYLEGYYLANPFIGAMQDFMLYAAGFLFIFVPSIALIISLTVGQLNPNNKMNIQAPRKMRWNL